MKRGLLIILVLLLSLSVVYASDVTYDVNQGDVLIGGSSQYDLKITNTESYDINAHISTIDLWNLDIENQAIFVPSESTKTVVATFSPKTNVKPGSYGINIIVKTQSTDDSSQVSRFEKVLPVNVIPYDKTVDVKFIPTAVVDPKNPTILKLNIINLHQISYKDLKLTVESPNFQTSQTFDLNKDETKIIEIPVSPSPETEEGTYNSQVKLMLDDKTLINKPVAYIVSAYENVKVLIEPESRFLYSGEQITRTNTGNTLVQQTYTKKFDFFAYKLASFNPVPTSINSKDGYIVTWQFSLAPGEAKTVGYAVNYRMPTLIVILIILAFAAWHVFRKKNAIVISKRVLTMHAESGSLHVMKVLISVKNRGNVTVKDIKLLDKVPASIRAPTKYGMHKPSKVQAVPEGTAMVWDIQALPAGQERLLSYAIEGKMQFLERIVLPPSRAKYILFGRQIIAKSLPASLRGNKNS